MADSNSATTEVHALDGESLRALFREDDDSDALDGESLPNLFHEDDDSDALDGESLPNLFREDDGTSEAPGTAPAGRGAAAVAPWDDTPLSKLLQKEGLADYKQAFYEQGYRRMDDLGSTIEEARAAITAVVEATHGDKPKGGDTNRLVASWAKSQGKDRQGKDRPLVTASLPAGATVDLTRPHAALESEGIKIPTLARSKASEVPLASELDAPTWAAIARANSLTFAIDLDAAMRGPRESGGIEAQRAAAFWKVPASRDFLRPDERSESETFISSSEVQSSLASNQIDEVGVSVSSPFVGLSGHLARDQKRASAEGERRVFSTGRWTYPRARIRLRDCLVPSDGFVFAVSAALGLPEESRFAGLRAVFDEYGHAFPEWITLGGMMSFQKETVVTSEAEEEEVKIDARVALKAQGASFQGEASAGHQSGTASDTSSKLSIEDTRWTAVGGDPLLESDPAQWAATVADPALWRVIDRRGLFSVIELLDDELRAGVEDVWRKGPIVPFEIRAGGGRFDPQVASFPGLTPADLPLQPVSVVDRKQINKLVDLDPNNELLQGLRWQAVYSGHTVGDKEHGQPLYWIVSSPGGSADAAPIDGSRLVLGAMRLARAVAHLTGIPDIPISFSSTESAKTGDVNDQYALCAVTADRAFPDRPIVPGEDPLGSDLTSSFRRSKLPFNHDLIYWTIEPRRSEDGFYIMNHGLGQFLTPIDLFPDGQLDVHGPGASQIAVKSLGLGHPAYLTPDPPEMGIFLVKPAS